MSRAAFCVLGLFLSASAAWSLDITAEGKGLAVIVSPENPTPVVKYAIKEFQDHIEQASGVRLDVVGESAAAGDTRNKIYIGPSKKVTEIGLAPETWSANEFSVANEGNALFLVGKDGGGVPPFDARQSMGTLFAVYEWLDGKLGVRWLWPGDVGTFVPKNDKISDSDQGQKKFSPPLLHTKVRYGGGPVFGKWQGVLSREEYDEFLFDTAVWLRRHKFACPVSFEYGHGFTEYWKRFGKENPEWFALGPDGKRGPIDSASKLVQMCVSNPELHAQIIRDWRVQREKDPALPWINGAENDKRAEDPSCSCEVCRSWDPRKGQVLERNDPFLIDSDDRHREKQPVKISLSDRYAKFWLALQKEGQKFDPKATIVGYAYADYAAPPVETKLNDRIIVWIVPPYVFPRLGGDVDEFKNLWSGWADTGAKLVLRPNYFFMGAALPYIYAKQFGAEFQFAAQNGLVGTDFDSLTSMWGTQGPNLYMLGRQNEKPGMDPDAVLGEYYSGFGNAAKYVQEYFELWERITKERVTCKFLESTPDYVWSGLYLRGNEVYRPEDLATAGGLLSKAMESVQGDERATKRIEFLQKGLKHTELSLATVAAFKKFRKEPAEESKAEFQESLKKLDSYRKKIASDNVVDLIYLNFLEERAGFGRKQIELSGNKRVALTLPLFWSFQWDPDGVGMREKWFDSNLDVSSWKKARTDKAWTRQAVGEEWKDAHGADYLGSAWYRTTFALPGEFKGKRVYLNFGAVDEGCSVWVNNRLVKERVFDIEKRPDLWKEPFLVDITDVAQFGDPSSLTVRVDKNHAGAGGIWKPVNILVD